MSTEKLTIINNQNTRSDIICYNKTGKPILVVECKAEKINLNNDVFNQVQNYNFSLKANYVIITNGKKTLCFYIKNEKFNFLKNLLIFPMKEITHSDSRLKSNKKLSVKMSNMNMNISIDFLNTKNKTKEGLWIEKSKLENYIIPTFTKKIFQSVKHNL